MEQYRLYSFHEVVCCPWPRLARCLVLLGAVLHCLSKLHLLLATVVVQTQTSPSVIAVKWEIPSGLLH